MTKPNLKDTKLTDEELEELSLITEDDIIDAQRTYERYSSAKFKNLLLIPKANVITNNPTN